MLIMAAMLAAQLIFRQRLIKAGFTVTSWYRSPQKNKKIGGVFNSRHLVGLAFDVVPVDKGSGELFKDLGFSKAINEGDHWHLEII